MDLPIRFPNEADKLYEEAQACQRMSFTERLRAIGHLTRACRALSGMEQDSEMDSRLRDERHRKLKSRLQEMAKQHGSG